MPHREVCSSALVENYFRYRQEQLAGWEPFRGESLTESLLCVDAALANRIRQPVDGQHVSGNSVVYVVGLSVAHHVLKRGHHDVLQLFIYDRFLPEIAL